MDYITGDLGKGGARACAVELQFEGRLGRAFIDFAIARARRLSLQGWVETGGPNNVIIVAEGPEALVDAFEISCSLGPIDAQVESWGRIERNIGLNTHSFERRS